MDEFLAETARRVPPRVEEAAAEKARRREAANAEADERLLRHLKLGVDALLDRKADKILVLKLQEVTSMADWFVLATATNDRQAQALADGVVEAIKADGRRPISLEGYTGASWILVDYGDVIFHVFLEEARRFYGLERLWGDAPDATSAFVPGRPPARG